MTGETEQPFQGHAPIWLTIPGFQELDLGKSVVTPKRIDTKDNDYQTFKEKQWKAIDEGIEREDWSRQAETCLLDIYELNKTQYKGRGQEGRVEKKSISAPHHPKDGKAHNAQGRAMQRQL